MSLWRSVLRKAVCWRKLGLTGGYLGSAMVIVESLSEPGSEGAGLWGGKCWGVRDHGSGEACEKGWPDGGGGTVAGGSVGCAVRGEGLEEPEDSWLMEDVAG